MQNPPLEPRRALLSAALALGVALASPPALGQSSNATPAPTSTTTLAPVKDPLAPPLLTQGTLGLAVGGVGGIAFLVGAGLGITATIKKGESAADGHCTGNVCDRTGAARLNTSLDYGNWSTVMFIAGSLLLVGGIVIMATVPGNAAPNAIPPRSVPVSAKLTLGPGSLVLSGAW